MTEKGSQDPGTDRQGSVRTYRLTVNGSGEELSVDGRMPLLWALRDHLHLTGTKYGCGRGYCGACMVHVDGRAVPSCTLPVEAVGESPITTIEGLSPDGEHPLQRTWVEERVPQCGYCQTGQIMSAAAFLSRVPDPASEELEEAMSGNVCRCGTYARIRRALERAATLMAEEGV